MEKSNGKENIRKETIRRYLSGKSQNRSIQAPKRANDGFLSGLSVTERVILIGSKINPKLHI